MGGQREGRREGESGDWWSCGAVSREWVEFVGGGGGVGGVWVSAVPVSGEWWVSECCLGSESLVTRQPFIKRSA